VAGKLSTPSLTFFFLLKKYNCEYSPRSLITNEHLNVIRTDGTLDPDVWAIGDAAKIQTAPLPATAQGQWKSSSGGLTDGKSAVANQKAKYLAKKLNKIVKDQDSPKPFVFQNQGSLAYIGDWFVSYNTKELGSSPLPFRRAIYDRSSAEKGIKTKESGRVAWLLWRSAYFTMTLSWRNRCPFNRPLGPHR
jgi:NADH dehydrogenase FAD-containing subunit